MGMQLKLLLHAGWTGILLHSLPVATQGTISFSPPATRPNGTSNVVSPHFAGFGIEPSNLFSFTGYATPNELTMNLLDNLASYAGAPAHIRLGGNTQDYMIYDDSMTRWTWISNPRSSGQGNIASDSMLIGPNFFAAANRFPKGTPITYGLNMAYDAADYIDQINQIATQAVTKMPNVNVVSFEIGNEPDLYAQNGFRTGTWGGQTYAQQWLDRASAVYDAVLKPNGYPANFFEPAATASTIGTSFQIHDLGEANIDAKAADANTSYIASWNQHDYYYYIGVSTFDLTMDYFMNLDTTESQFAAWVTQVQQAHDTPYPYALREYCPVGPIGLQGITDTFAAALWQLNFFLYAATLNITAVGMHQTDNSNASAWLPIAIEGQQPHVRPIYYGHVAFDQVIGPACQASVVANAISQFPAGYDGRIRSYSIYQGDTFSSMVVINSQIANASGTAKDSVSIDLTLPPQFAGQTLYLAYLTNDGTDATTGTTFNGISFEQSGNGKPTVADSTEHTVPIDQEGRASVTVRDSQAVVAQVGTPVGRIPANTAACASVSVRSGSAAPGPNGSTTSSNSASATSSGAALSARMGSSTWQGILPLSIITTGVTAFMSGGMLMLW